LQLQLTILTSRVIEGTWTKPEVARFSGKHDDAVTSISPDGNSLFFNSMRPQRENKPPFEAQNIWVMEKQANERRNPQMLPPPVNSDAREMGGFLSKDGYFYFSTSRQGEISGKCRAKLVNGEFTRIEGVDHFYNFDMPCFEVARDPDEKFIRQKSSKSGDRKNRIKETFSKRLFRFISRNNHTHWSFIKPWR